MHDVATVRRAEAALMATLPEGTLMQRAAAGLARRCAGLLDGVYGSRVVLLVGKGDNGGDALYAGARLAARGARVTAALAADTAHTGGLAALRAAGGRVVAAAAAEPLLAEADLIVDGLLGIGGSGGLRPPADRLALLAAEAPGPVVAVDLPSGVDADTGRVGGVAVRADVTVTFGTWKPALVVAPAAEHAGLVELVDIGLDPHLPPAQLEVLGAGDVAALLPLPAPETDKYHRGVVGVVAGSNAYTGAAVLATGGAVHAGAGMVRFASVAHPAELVRARWPEAVVTVVEPGDAAAVLAAGRVQAWVVGPGLGTDAAAAAIVRRLLAEDVPVLVDADGLTVLAEHPEWLAGRGATTLLTPHAGEFARLRGVERDEVEASRLDAVRRAAAELGATVLLKGSTTLVAEPNGRVRANPTGTPWLGTAGSGDVLSGACGALLAAGLPALDAGSVAAFLHGLAAHLAAGAGSDAEAPIAAPDLLARWADAVRAVRT